MIVKNRVTNKVKLERERRNWSYGELARRAGCMNVSKAANRICRFERGEAPIPPELFWRVVQALEMNPESMNRLIEQEVLEDERREREEFERWASVPIRPYLAIRFLAACYVNRSLPESLKSKADRIEYARQQAMHGFSCPVHACLVLSRRRRIWILPDDTYRHEEATPGTVNLPVMRLRGTRQSLRFE